MKNKEEISYFTDCGCGYGYRCPYSEVIYTENNKLENSKNEPLKNS